MKIGISVTPVYNLNGQAKNIDGIGTYTAHLCQALAVQNVPVQEIYFKKTRDTLKAAPAQTNFQVGNNPLYSLLPGNFYNETKKNIDLLHITNYLVPRIKTVPTISTIHDAIMLKRPEWLEGSKYLRHLKGQILKKLNQQVDFVLTCSQASVADIVNYWQIPEHKIAVTHYGLASVWHEPIDELMQQQVLRRYRLAKPFFLTVGTLQPRKNIERTINAYLSLPKNIRENFNLVIVGKNHPTLTPPSLLTKIHQLEQTGQLIWLKYLPFTELRCLYQTAYLLLFPSLEEGFGFPVLEGFASRTPVITANFGATAEIAGKAAYLVDPYSEETIAAAVVDLVENKDIRQQFIHQGQARVQAFTWEECAKKTIQIYKKFL